jgi:hypothetical protein
VSVILIFYGFSGDPGVPVPSFPGGRDRNRSFEMVAETLATSIRKLFPGDTVEVHQAWTKEAILSTIEAAPDPIRQVHVACHGDSDGLSLAYHYDHLSRLDANVTAIEAMAGTDEEKGVQTLLDDDALQAGLFARGLDPARRATLRGKFAAGAGWQIWGCWSGYEATTFGDSTGPVATPRRLAYWRRLNFGPASVPGVAIDIAVNLGVTVTAARDGWGLSFWHGKPDRSIHPNGNATPARPPFWLWNTPGSKFVSFGPNGVRLPKAIILGAERSVFDLLPGRPPSWLTDLYWQ